MQIGSDEYKKLLRRWSTLRLLPKCDNRRAEMARIEAQLTAAELGEKETEGDKHNRFAITVVA